MAYFIFNNFIPLIVVSQNLLSVDLRNVEHLKGQPESPPRSLPPPLIEREEEMENMPLGKMRKGYLTNLGFIF